jgi:hypothetical protein
MLPADRIEPVTPNEEFMQLRDEILMQIIGVDGSLPVYHMLDDDPRYGDLPCGSVRMNLGRYACRIPLSAFEFGFGIEPASGMRLYYPDEGIELDVLYADDAPFGVVRYLYIANSSRIKLPGGVGIGSAVGDVVSAYGAHIIPDFQPMLAVDDVIALGSDVNGVYFVIRGGRVYSIYVATIREDSPFSRWIAPLCTERRLYPAWFDPDREYIETTQPSLQ